MWSKIGNFERSYHNLNFIMISPEFFLRALFKFNNLGLALGMSLKFYTTVAQELKSQSFRG